MLNGSNAGMSICQQMVIFLGGVCTLISVFGAVALIVVVYLIIFFSLKLYTRVYRSPGRTDTIHCSVSCLLVHQEETAEESS